MFKCGVTSRNSLSTFLANSPGSSEVARSDIMICHVLLCLAMGYIEEIQGVKCMGLEASQENYSNHQTHIIKRGRIWCSEMLR